VRACRYFPLATAATPGCARVGRVQKLRDYLDTVNNELVIVPMIETKQSLRTRCHRLGPGRRRPADRGPPIFDRAGVPLDYSCDTYQRALDKIAAADRKARHRRCDVFHPAEMDPKLLRPEGVQVLHHAVGSLGEDRDPERPVRDQALTTVVRRKVHEECCQAALAKIADR